jgi:hypothetical protein
MHFRLILAALALTPAVAAAQQPSSQQPASPVTAIMATLTVRPDVERAQINKVLPDEVAATVRLYLDGKIQQWWARADGRGVVFIMNCSSTAEAKALTDQLPLVKGNLASFDFAGLMPLTPLRVLLPPAAAQGRGSP